MNPELYVMTHCCHDTLYEDCVFGCKLWQYTRTGRSHYINDEEYTAYSDGPHWNLWVIADSCGGISGIAGSKGYDLYHKGKRIKHGKTVKELKTHAQEKTDEIKDPQERKSETGSGKEE